MLPLTVLVVVATAVFAYDPAQFLRDCADRLSTGANPTFADANVPCVMHRLAALHHLPLSIEFYTQAIAVIARGACAPRCRVLLFRADVDAPIWLAANPDGATVFVDSDPTRIDAARRVAPYADVRRLELRTNGTLCRTQINDIDARYWELLPPDLEAQPWDVIVINGDPAPGAGYLQPCWWAAKSLVRRVRAVHLFVDVVNGPCQRHLGEQFFTSLFRTDPLIVTAADGSQFAHWDIAQRHNSIGHAIGASTGQFVVVSLSTRATPVNASDCVVPLTSLVAKSLERNAQIAPTDYIHVEIPVIDRKASFGQFGSDGFRRATHLKTQMVLVALRLGRDLVLTDIDIFYTKPLPVTRFRDAFNAMPNLHIIAQQELVNRCPTSISVNTGFYCVRSSAWTLRFLQRVADESVKSGMTEQRLWNKILNGVLTNKTALGSCGQVQKFAVMRADWPVALLPMEEAPNGFWMRNAAIRDPFLRHFNYIIGYCSKLAQLREFVAQFDARSPPAKTTRV